MGRIRGKAVICEEVEEREECGRGRENSICSDLGKSLDVDQEVKGGECCWNI